MKKKNFYLRQNRIVEETERIPKIKFPTSLYKKIEIFIMDMWQVLKLRDDFKKSEFYFHKV